MSQVYEKSIHGGLESGNAFLFHGYNIHYKKIIPPPNINVIMVAPSGAGKIVRQEFESGSGVPNLLAVYQDYTHDAFQLALSYSSLEVQERLLLNLHLKKRQKLTYSVSSPF